MKTKNLKNRKRNVLLFLYNETKSNEQTKKYIK
jgi:hypothetical protein